MGIIKQDQLNHFEYNHSEYNLDKNGDYIECRECQSELKKLEKHDDLCFECKMKKED